MRIPDSLRLALQLALLTMVGCASASPSRTSPSERLWLTVGWRGGGIAPIGEEIRIYRDGTLRRNDADTEMEAHLSPLEAHRLKRLLESDELRKAERTTRALGYRAGCCDSPEVGFAGAFEVNLDCESEVPSVVVDLVEQVNAIARAHLDGRDVVPADCLRRVR